MTALIIDDEAKARNLLYNILNEYCPQVTEIHQATSLIEGVRLIKKHKPNVVFLDIEMPEYLGTELFDFIEKKEVGFNLIFTTAYNHYAIKAFDMNALDYLLKPLRPQQIKNALNKIKQEFDVQEIYQQLEALKESHQNNEFKKIGLPIADGLLFVKLTDIIYLEAKGMYTQIHLQGRSKQLISKPLKYFIGLLDEIDFFYKPHRSFLLNLNFVAQYLNKDGHFAIMENEEAIPLARHKKEEFLLLLKERYS
jgi:two-component system LytT family response regulator